MAEKAACANTPADKIVQRYLRSRAGVELTKLADLLRVRSLSVLSRHFEQHGQVLQLGMAEEHTQSLADQAVADVVVPVAVRSERRLGVVRVQRAQAVEPDPPVEVLEQP